MISIVKMCDASNNDVYPITHLRAVRDSNGTTLESMIQGVNETTVGYYECTTAGSTPEKTITIDSSVSLSVRISCKVKFAEKNTGANATMNINNTGAKPLFYNGVRAAANNSWYQNEIVDLYFDGTNYQAKSCADTLEYDVSLHQTHEITEVTTTTRTVVYNGDVTSGWENETSVSDSSVNGYTRTETNTGKDNDTTTVDGPTAKYDTASNKTSVVYVTKRTLTHVVNDYTFDEAVNAVPMSYRHGGLKLRFISNSNGYGGKYVCYFLKKSDWSNSISDWEKTNLENEVKELDLIVNGIEDELIAEMDSNPHTAYTFLPNPLLLGEKYRAEMNVTYSQWTRILFSKVGTDSSESSDKYIILEKNTIGNYEVYGTAPDPSIYPYIAYQKNGVSNKSTAKLYKSLYQEGLEKKVQEIQDGLMIEKKDNINLIINSLYVYNGLFSQNSAWATKYIYGKRGYRYFVDVQTTTKGIQLSTSKSTPASNTPTQLIAGSFNETTLTSVVDVNDPCYIAISYAKSGEVSISIKEEISKTEEVRVRALPLSGRKVLMFGDSITQLPLDVADGAKGIVEYFSDVTGANGIRGAFGGSHLRARRIVNSVDDIDLNDSSVEMQEHAKATLDLVYIVKALCEQDFSLQDRAMEWYELNRTTDDGVDNSWTYWANIINVLKSLDMSTINAFTIFIGTNDYSNNVPLNDDDHTPSESTNIQRENGAWNYILEQLSTTYPSIPIFIFTPIVRIDSSTSVWIPDTPNGAGLTLRQYAENTIAAAKRFYIPVCDLMEELGWNKFNFWSFFNSGDGTHPRKGFQHIGTKMASFVTSHWDRY